MYRTPHLKWCTIELVFLAYISRSWGFSIKLNALPMLFMAHSVLHFNKHDAPHTIPSNGKDDWLYLYNHDFMTHSKIFLSPHASSDSPNFSDRPCLIVSSHCCVFCRRLHLSLYTSLPSLLFIEGLSSSRQLLLVGATTCPTLGRLLSLESHLQAKIAAGVKGKIKSSIVGPTSNGKLHSLHNWTSITNKHILPFIWSLI